jgi:glycosyltransferase involved in cell wall biosynthesis
MRRPRILQLISSGGLYGAENVVLELSRTLQVQQCESRVGVFLNTHRPNLQIAEAARSRGLEVEVFECRGRIDRKAVRSVRSYLTRCQIDILHAHGYKANAYGLRASQNTAVKTIATSHSWPGRTLRLRTYTLLDWIQLRRFDHVCAVSEDGRHALLRALVPESKITVVPNGIDYEKFSGGCPILKSAPQFKERLLIGYVGRLAPEKNLHALIAALKELVLTFPFVALVLCGEGPERAALQDLANRLGIDGNVCFLGRRSDLADVYASFDLFVLPSLSEGMPLSLLEAMAAKIPVVATRVGEVPKILEEGKIGMLVDPGSRQELESALRHLVLNPEERLSLGQAGFDAVRSKYSSELMAQTYLSIYSEVLSAKPENCVLTTAGSAQK